MSKKANITDTSSGYMSNETINQNFTNLNDQFENTISRDGSTPNQMGADFDLNNYNLLNVNILQADDIVLNGDNLDDAVINAAENALIYADSAEQSAEDAAASAELATSGAVWIFDTVAEAVAETTVLVDQTAFIEGRQYLIVAGGTYTATGNTVINLTGSSLQAVLVSKEAVTSIAELEADTRLDGDFSTGDLVEVQKEEALYEKVASDPDLTTAGGAKFQKVSQQEVKVTVGDGRDFATVNAALAYLSTRYRSYKIGGVKATIELKGDHVLAEQIICRHGIDLSWIEITGEDGFNLVDASAITDILVPLDSGALGVFMGMNAKLPKLSVILSYGGVSGTRWDGVVLYNSEMEIAPGCGIRYCRNGIVCYHGSVVTCVIDGLRSSAGSDTTQKGVDFRECSGRALDVQYGGKANLPRSEFYNCTGDVAVYCIWGNSEVGIFQSNVSGASGEAVLSRDGGRVDARECDTSGSFVCLHALHGGYINARSKPGTSWTGDGAKNSGDYAVQATHNSIIEAEGLQVDGAARRGVYAGEGSRVNIKGGTGLNCANEALMAENGGFINAEDFDGSGSDIGAWMDDEGDINAPRSTFDGCRKPIYLASGGKGNFSDSSAQNCTGDWAVEAIQNAHPTLTNLNASGSAGGGIRFFEGTHGTAVSADVSGAGGDGIVCSRLSSCAAELVDASSVGGTGFVVSKGSEIQAHNASGSLSKTANTVTSDGIIYQ